MIIDDTICALATPPGIGGLSIIRLSGPEAFSIADQCFRGKISISEAKSHTIHFGAFVFDTTTIDSVTAFIYRSPHSYTGENVIEFGCHGGMILYQEILSALQYYGARHAEPGEFTKRAFLNGKLDLPQVEAVADLIHSVSKPGTQIAARQLFGGFTNKLRSFREELLEICGLLELELDFSQEDIEFVDRNELQQKLSSALILCQQIANSFYSSEILRSGFSVGIIGYPNAGKSSLLNALLQRSRAIVSSTPGTTRDFIEELVYINNIPIKFFDTAGFRSTSDAIELEGISLAQDVLKQCNLIIILNDYSLGIDSSSDLIKFITSDYSNIPVLVVQNKIDLVYSDEISHFSNGMSFISASNNIGIDSLKASIASIASSRIDFSSDYLINSRHVAILHQIIISINSAISALSSDFSNEFIALDVRMALKLLGTLTGDHWNEDLLSEIFSKFCIGK